MNVKQAIKVIVIANLEIEVFQNDITAWGWPNACRRDHRQGKFSNRNNGFWERKISIVDTAAASMLDSQPLFPECSQFSFTDYWLDTFTKLLFVTIQSFLLVASSILVLSSSWRKYYCNSIVPSSTYYGISFLPLLKLLLCCVNGTGVLIIFRVKTLKQKNSLSVTEVNVPCYFFWRKWG